jgi:hypothetical protein
VGKIEAISTIPKKLTAYFPGDFADIMRRKYSTVKMIVKNHSSINNTYLYSVPYASTLSTITTSILKKIDIIRVTSNALPAGVSA